MKKKLGALFLTLALICTCILPGTAAHAAQTAPNQTAAQTDTRPEAPVLISVERKAYNRFKITWSKVPGANGYYIGRKKEGSKHYKRIADVKGNKKHSFVDKTFVCNTKYTYLVKAYRKVNGEIVKSKKSNTIEKKSKYKGMQKVNNCLYYFDKKYKCCRKVDGRKKMICLTYDDGPSANTATILKTLKKYDSTATFFVVGNRVSSYRSAVKKADKYLCQIGNHTYSHATLTRLSASDIRSQMARTDDAVKKIIGKKTAIMRPPGGSYNSTVRNNVKKPLLYWSVDTRDWATRSSTKTIRAVLNNAKDGDVVLMHDLYQSTADASKTIIPGLVKKGYQLVTVEEMAQLRGGMKNGSVYFSFRR